MAARPVPQTIRGTSRPHLRGAKGSYRHPHYRRPGGRLIPGADPRVEADAACAGENTELFFSDEPGAVEAAKAICDACPVRTACLERALANGEKYGVFGGLTAKERHKLATRKGAAA